jgi:uncharacterized membrane protein
LARGAYWLLSGGIATGLLAGITGLIDFVTIREAHSSAAGWVHLVGNVAAIVAAAINVALRTDDVAEPVKGWGVGLSAAIVVLLCITGWLGGELSYRYRT